jgi:N6-L-threonylcarbamoyladenine synthase
VIAVLPVIKQALTEAGCRLDEIDLFAVTAGPGLVGSLLVGLETAKVIAYVHGAPLIGVNHIEGHLLSPFLDDTCRPHLAFPSIALVVSGGHTSLFLVHRPGHYEALGRTLDDAAGEAFDKISKRLGGPYPGGPYIEEMALAGNSSRYKLPRPLIGRGLSFSFSGLKTAANTLIAKLEQEDREERAWLPDFCASAQQAIVDTLTHKAITAAIDKGCAQIIVVGGVACNKSLRNIAEKRSAAKGLSLIVPAPLLCTDNGAMIACAGTKRYQLGPKTEGFPLQLDVSSNLELVNWC